MVARTSRPCVGPGSPETCTDDVSTGGRLGAAQRTRSSTERASSRSAAQGSPAAAGGRGRPTDWRPAGPPVTESQAAGESSSSKEGELEEDVSGQQWSLDPRLGGSLASCRLVSALLLCFL